MNATVQEVAGGYALRLERHLRHPVEDVWAAITEPGRMAEWLGSGEIELALGGRIKIVIRAGDDPTVGTVTAFDPPYVLEYTMTSDSGVGAQSSAAPEPLRWELAPEDGGTRLVLTHTIAAEKAPDAPKYQAGWACVLDSLEGAVRGERVAFSMEAWRAYYDEFGGAAKFGSITTVPGGYEMHFVRHLAHPTETVWAALTESDQLAKWLAPASIELRVGGRAFIDFSAQGSTVDGRVTVIEPGRVLEYTWLENGEDKGGVRWELASEGAGTRLSLMHGIPTSTGERLDFMAGWHDLLDRLELVLKGGTPTGSEDNWHALQRSYEALRIPELAE